MDNNSTTRVHKCVNSQTNKISLLQFCISNTWTAAWCVVSGCLSTDCGDDPGAPASASACLPTVRPDWPARGVPPASLWEECCFQVFLHHLSRIALLFSEPVTPYNLFLLSYMYAICAHIFFVSVSLVEGEFLKKVKRFTFPDFKLFKYFYRAVTKSFRLQGADQGFFQ